VSEVCTAPFEVLAGAVVTASATVTVRIAAIGRSAAVVTAEERVINPVTGHGAKHSCKQTAKKAPTATVTAGARITARAAAGHSAEQAAQQPDSKKDSSDHENPAEQSHTAAGSRRSASAGLFFAAMMRCRRS